MIGRKYKDIVAHCGSVIAAMDYSPMFAGTTVSDCLRLATKSVLELDQLIDDMPKLSGADVSSDEVVQFLSDWHDWQDKVTKCRRANDVGRGSAPQE